MPTPDQIANLEMWYKADAITGLNDGDPVSTWSDSSGNNRNMVQATAGKKPLFKTNQTTFGGKPVVRFDGTDDGLRLAGAILTSQAGTVFAVVKCTKASGNADVLDTADEASSSFFQINRFDATNLKILVFSNDGVLGHGATGDTVMNREDRFLMMWGSSGTAFRIRVNGIEQIKTIINSDSGMWWGDIANRDNWTIGYYDGSLDQNFFQGDIAEVIIYSRLLTAQEISDIETYLFDKYPAPANFDHLIPLQFKYVLNSDLVIPAQFRLQQNYDQIINLVWDLCRIFENALLGEFRLSEVSLGGRAHCMIRAQEVIPLLYRIRTTLDAVIPIQWKFDEALKFDLAIAILWRILVEADSKIPLQFSLFSDWVKQAASQSDAFAAQSASAADAWTKQGASQAPTWTPE